MAQFNERLRTAQEFLTDRGADNATAGTLTNVSTAGTSFLRFTAATVINSFAGGVTGKHLLITNANSVSVSILNESAAGTAANRIITGTTVDITLAAGASLFLVYDDSAQRWRVVGSSGGSGYSSTSQLSLTNGGTISGIVAGFNKVLVQGGAGAVTLSSFPFGTGTPLNGTVLLLVGNSSTNTVSININDDAKGFVGNGEVEIFKGSTLTMVYDATLDRWIETARCTITIN